MSIIINGRTFDEYVNDVAKAKDKAGFLETDAEMENSSLSESLSRYATSANDRTLMVDTFEL